MMRSVVAYLRPAAVVAFVDHVFAVAALASPPVPLLDFFIRQAREIFARTGRDPATGRHLHRIFLAAGLRAPEQRLESRFFSGPDADYAAFATALRSVLPQLVALGIASEAEVGVETFAARLR